MYTPFSKGTRTITITLTEAAGELRVSTTVDPPLRCGELCTSLIECVARRMLDAAAQHFAVCSVVYDSGTQPRKRR